MSAETHYPDPPLGGDDRTENELVHEFKEGREAAIEKIVRDLGPVVLRRLKRQFVPPLSEADLDDVLSVALFRLWMSRSKYDPSACPLAAWLYLIAKSVAIDFVRQQHGMVNLDQVIESLLPAGGTEDTESPMPSLDVRGPLLRRLLESLPEKDRQIVLTLARGDPGEAWTEPLTHEFGMSANALRVRRNRIVQRLREQLS